MFQYSNEQLSTIIGVPLVTLLTIWTLTIFHKNRKKWSSFDIAIVAILIQSILRNLMILCYTSLVIAKESWITMECCRVIVWVFNSVHTFQASSLTTLAVIALFTARLRKKRQTLHQYLTPTHVIYHLFCLTTLCACVGVAAILAQEDADLFFAQRNNVCKFMPFELDVKFNIFIIVLHTFLALVSIVTFLFMCSSHAKKNSRGDFQYLKKSTSDLSDLSTSLTASVASPLEAARNYYDTYTIHRAQFASQYEVPGVRETGWNSDMSNISTTVSSTNSKKPCLGNKALKEEDEADTGLSTMYPILAVCYLCNHLPLIVLCIFPRLVLPWTVSGVALWMGQLQDVLIPIGLGMVDGRFCKWVSFVYKCAERRQVTDKIPPGVGLDGKFRHFGSQPPSLDGPQTVPDRSRLYSPSEHKFPITNGSLYTSIDGRLPIIHNYRRHNQHCQKIITQPHLQNMSLHSSHLHRPQACENHQQTTYIPHVNQQFVVQHICNEPTYFHDITKPKKVQPKHISRSQDALDTLDITNDALPGKNRLVRQKLMRNRTRNVPNRISKSEDSLNDIQKDLLKFKENPEVFQQQPHKHDFSVSSEDDYFFDTGIDYDGTSQSSYSITTEANCDFEFYQNKDNETPLSYHAKKPELATNMKRPNSSCTDVLHITNGLRITRSNSKRSLENFQAYVEEESNVKVQRASSFLNVDDRKVAAVKQRNTSKAESVQVVQLNHQHCHYLPRCSPNKGGLQSASVPDFKRIFISDYI